MGFITEAASSLKAAINNLVTNATDEVALESVVAYPKWSTEKQYAAGERCNYNGVLYKCLQDHTGQNDWTPTEAPSLWAKVLISDTETIPEWEQPESTNAYALGDKVTHDGKTWVSDVDDNVWEPGVYGWSEV